MLLGFFDHLRRYEVPVSLREFIDLLTLMRNNLVFADQDDFYFMSRMALVKDEKYYDRFDRAFAAYFDGMDRWVGLFDDDDAEIRKEVSRHLAMDAEVRQLLNDYQSAVKTKRDTLLDELSATESGEVDGQDRGEGEGEGEGEGQGEGEGEGEGQGEGEGEGESGNEGQGEDGERGEGTSEEGEDGERSEEVGERRQRATKVWLEREFVDYDPDVELGTRNLKLALRRLRRWAREAADLELDLKETISSTARSGGILDIVEVPERHNAVKVLMLYDVGGSMDEHIDMCSQLFSAARSEFKHLGAYYFHNFLYESVWEDNERRFQDKVPTWQLIHRYPSDYKLIIVGDAEMGQWEITEKGGSVEHFNAEPGEVWLKRLRDHFRSVVWINPVPEKRWQDSFSIRMVNKRMEDEMYFLSDSGLASAMKALMR